MFTSHQSRLLLLPLLGIGIAVSPNQAFCQDISAGLVGHWKLDETNGTTAYDSSESEDDGIYTGSVITNVAGPDLDGSTIAIELDDSGDHVALPNIQHDFSAGFAASMWVRPATLSSSIYGYKVFFSLANGIDQDEIWIGWLTGYGFHYYTIGDHYLHYSSVEDYQEFTAGVWTHCVVNVDADGFTTLYRNGKPVVSNVPTTLPTNISRTANFIGESVWDDNYDGRLHDVRLYNRPLTANEVEILAGLSPLQGIRIMQWIEVL